LPFAPFCLFSSDSEFYPRHPRAGIFEGFTADHDVKMLIWYEQHATMETAILREKQIKKWNRQWKINLIEMENPNWRDLAVDLGFPTLPSRKL
jgi:putative endonuclease